MNRFAGIGLTSFRDRLVLFPAVSLRVSHHGVLTLLLIIAAHTFLLPDSVCSADPPAKPDSDASEETEPTDKLFEFALTVVGPDDQPVPDARIEIRSTPKLNAGQIQRGRFDRGGNYGVFARTDEQGRLTVQLPATPQRFNVSIKHPGYGPYWAGWDNSDHPEKIPPRFTAQLEAAWTVGGVVVDSSGQSVPDVEVKPSVTFKKRPGDTSRLGVGTHIKTDANGRWEYRHVPASKSDVHVAFNHADYRPLRRSLPRSGFEILRDEQPSAPIELDRGLMITGTVTDEAGKPIADALVRTKFLNDIRQDKTDAEGVYHLRGCEPRMTQVVASAEGRAIEMQTVRVDPELQPVDFTLKPGGKVRIRVVDEEGNGIPKTRIFFQRWRREHAYFPFDHVDQYADENGVWEWNEAPLDEFQADICRPDGMQLSERTIVAREKEYVFRPPPALVVTGRVIDAKTKQPIKRFRVTPGLRNRDPQIGKNWIPRDSYESSDGTYRVRFTREYPAHLVQIEAEGYQVAVSRDILSDEGNVRVDFELQPAEDIAATIVSATGKLAAGAKLALGVHGSQISIDNGEIDDGSTYAFRLDADEQGRFRLAARNEPFQIVITHPDGFAYLKSAEGPIPDPIILTPWAKVEGVFRVGSEIAPHVTLSVSGGIHSYGDGVPNIFTHHEITTGEKGQFVFERVFPGTARVGRRILLMVDDGATEVTSSKSVAIKTRSGETARLELGGDGRPVVGTLAPPDGSDKDVLWNFALIHVSIDLAPLPPPQVPDEIANNPAQRKAWEATVGKTWQSAREANERLRSESPWFTASVDRDGSFRIDDVPPGNYALGVRFSKEAPGRLANYRFTVPVKPDTAPAAPPIDLGQIQLN